MGPYHDAYLSLCSVSRAPTPDPFLLRLYQERVVAWRRRSEIWRRPRVHCVNASIRSDEPRVRRQGFEREKWWGCLVDARSSRFVRIADELKWCVYEEIKRPLGHKMTDLRMPIARPSYNHRPRSLFPDIPADLLIRIPCSNRVLSRDYILIKRYPKRGEH